jgi:hypothetical protein
MVKYKYQHAVSGTEFHNQKSENVQLFHSFMQAMVGSVGSNKPTRTGLSAQLWAS